jgi:hypothetical protein
MYDLISFIFYDFYLRFPDSTKERRYSLKRYVRIRFGASIMSQATESAAVLSGRNLHIYRKQVLSPLMHFYEHTPIFLSRPPAGFSDTRHSTVLNSGGRGFSFLFTPWHFLLHCLFWPRTHLVPPLPTDSHAYAAPGTCHSDSAHSGLFSNPEDGDNTFLRKVDEFLLSYTASHTRTQ